MYIKFINAVMCFSLEYILGHSLFFENMEENDITMFFQCSRKKVSGNYYLMESASLFFCSLSEMTFECFLCSSKSNYTFHSQKLHGCTLPVPFWEKFPFFDINQGALCYTHATFYIIQRTVLYPDVLARQPLARNNPNEK